ncbi:MAG: AAA family ATPase [Rhodoferax sp.]|jgi:predicted ATPase|uniref:ATP-dependent nuclease n=1 Tax=Rhodoferax sp. TaxID=50421 RepID=UPI001B5E3FD9|nr:AAA family ATPase [Rhodoferax sp.]MBP9148048.1 AAA family ATPase [Rhodoferax sp.]MBP9735974.1 AAA family ATPase [Rhodoferax sp.]
MIRLVTLKNFKRFGEVEFRIPDHVVLAGPNNTGKTTLLQAIAAWELGFRKWLELNDFNPRQNGYRWQELERLNFSAVAVRSFEMLWTNRRREQAFEIGIQVDGLPMLTLEFKYQSAGSLQVRPKNDAALNSTVLQNPALRFQTTFIPAMSGLARIEQRLADQEAIDSALAQGRPGEVLRNLLYIAHKDEAAWRALNATMQRLFACRLESPKSGAELICEYRQGLAADAPLFDVASAGSGFLQVLLLLTLLLTQSQRLGGASSVLLIDEPDAHLHLLLQHSIYSELRDVAVARQAQLFVATHSEMIVNKVESRELYMMYGTPRLVSGLEKDRLRDSLGALTHSDILEADGARGVLYTEDFTDVDVLKAFAKVLQDDAALKLLSHELIAKSSQAPLPDGLGVLTAQKHWDMLKLIRQDLPALDMLDGDSKSKADDFVDGAANKMQRIRWRRYEIESYLIHPDALQRFVEKRFGGAPLSNEPVAAMLDELRKTLQQDFLDKPNEPVPLVEAYFTSQPVSKKLIPALLQAAGLNNVPKRDYFEIAAQFKPEEVHPEVVERLNQIKQAFGVAGAVHV